MLPRQHQSAQQGQTKAQTGRTAHFGHRGQATAHQPLRPQPFGPIGAPGTVACIVEQVGAGLNAQHAATGQQQRRQTGSCTQMDTQGRAQEDGNQRQTQGGRAHTQPPAAPARNRRRGVHAPYGKGTDG